MSDFKRYTVTAALPYTNGPLHIGHIAGAYLPADVYVRYLRAQGKDVAFICGSDEHGAAITLKAKKEGITPQAIIDKYHQLNKDAFERFGVSFDIFDRTSSDEHHKMAQEFFLTLHNKGVFEERVSEQFYDAEYDQFLADRYITGTCPKCGHDAAYGDQCEKCGSDLSPEELIEPKSTLSGKTPELKTTKHWYLPLNKYEDFLNQWIVAGEGQTEPWKRNVVGQCKSWITGGLQPRAMTRDLNWGVKVPLKDAEGKVLYVWLDAPIGYISATKKWAEQNGKQWTDYWQNDDTKLVHFIGKDNIVFHCIIFPALLKAHGDYILPTNVPANEFLNLEGQKLSTSRNWAVWLSEYLDDFEDNKDILRYVLCSIAPETKDSEFTWKDFQQRINSELVGILGNFVNRILVLHQKYFNGAVTFNGELSEKSKALFNEIQAIEEGYHENMRTYKFRDAQNKWMDLARVGNRYLTEEEPWKQFKTNPTAVEEPLYVCLQICARLALLGAPFLPDFSQKLRTLLGGLDANWSVLNQFEIVKVGTDLPKPNLLFSKIEDATIEAQIEKLQQPSESNFEPVKDEIQFDDFTKMDLRVGVITEAEKVKKANRLLKLTVDLGFETRTIVSGIAEHFKPEEVVGQQVTVLVNLAPRKLRGIESQGMVLMSETSDGQLQFVHTSYTVNPGAGIS